MQTQAIQSKLSKAFDRCQLVDSKLLLCEKQYKGTPWAIYYFDASNEIPSDEKSLYDYQDKILAKRYFESAKSLQWNHYLVFLVDDELLKIDDFVRQKTIIERDKNFARKFLLREKELDAFVNPRQWLPRKSGKPEDIASVWLEILDKNRLSKIYSYNESRRHVVDDVLNDWRNSTEISRSEPSKNHSLPATKPDSSALKFIEKLENREYRPFPPQKNFNFGRVNLIYGPNGTGKTSLLEAIEYFYCGQNHRSADRKTPSKYRIAVQLKGDDFYAKINHSSAERLKRDLEWFGTHGRRKNELVSNFNRYIFFNSDAGFFLEHSEKNQDITTALARLALGEEVNKLWDEINKYVAEFRGRLPGLSSTSKFLDKRISELDKLLSQLKKPTVIIDVIFERLVKVLEEYNIKKIPKHSNEVSSSFLDSILDLEAFFEDIAQLNWIDILTIENIQESKNFLVNTLREFEKILKETENLQIAEIEGKQERDEANRRKGILNRIKRYITSNWEVKRKEMRELEQIVSGSQFTATILDSIELKLLPDDYSKLSLSGASRKLAQKLSLCESELKTKENSLKRLQVASTEIQKTVVEIHALGLHFLKNSPHATDCPLCGTHYSEAELKRRLSRLSELETSDEKNTKELVTDTSTLKRSLKLLKKQEATLGRLDDLLSNLNLPRGTLISELMIQAQNKVSMLESQQSQLKTLELYFKRLRSDDYSEEEYEELLDEIHSSRGEEKHEKGIFDLAFFQSEQLKVEQLLKNARTILENISNSKKHLLSQTKELSKKLGKPSFSAEEAVKVVTERLSLINTCLEHFRNAIKFLSIEKEDSLSTISRGIMTISKMVREFIKVNESEEIRSTQLEQATTEHKQREEERKVADGFLARCKSVISVLENIIKKHSRETMVQDFISENKKRISEIFATIHAPREFTEVEHIKDATQEGGELQLVKKEDGKRKSVSEISTGQRTALALSIFLCLNEKLENAPRLILLDDPVAQVDDLNALSFLDFLRDIVMSNTRQVFFATADEKLAGLFERKFSFLGDEFRRFPLSRPSG